MKRMILALASMVLVLTACSKDEEEEAQPFNPLSKMGLLEIMEKN